MTVYLLISVYCNDVGIWENVLDVYAKLEDAELAKNSLDQDNEDLQCQSYDVRGYPVL